MKAMLCMPALFYGPTVIANPGAVTLPAADTITLDVPTAEQHLIGNSLMLLAAHCNVDIAKSEVTQARAWYNPNILYTQTLYDPSSGRWLDNNPSSGQVDVQVNELFSIAGKHINSIRLAELNVQRNQLAFDDLSRALKFEMYNDLADLYEAQQTDLVYSTEVKALDDVIAAAKQELHLGAAAGNDVIRLKAERQSTITDQLSNLNFIETMEAQLRTLLGYGKMTWLKIVKMPLPGNHSPALDSLLSQAMLRPDVMLAATDLKWNQQNLRLQHSQSIPDLLAGTEYDRRSSYVNNLWTVHAGIDIPIFNRNQGNIKVAHFELLQAQYNDSLMQYEVQSEVVSAYGQFLRTMRVHDSITIQPGIISWKSPQDKGSYSADIDLLFVNAIENYGKRRISLIEFLDQLRTYEDARRGLITLESDYFKAAQRLNYVTGTTIIR